MNGYQLAEHIGASYRQVNWWTRQGYLQPVNDNPGSGHSRSYTDAETAIAYMIAQLVRAGMNPAYAARIARRGASLCWSVGRLVSEGAA